MNKLSNNLDFKLINKFHNINLYANITGTHTFTLNETIKNVRSIKLISAELVGLKSGAWDSKHIVILHIDELKYNTISSTKENNKLNNSFLTFDIYDRFNPTGVFYHFYNTSFDNYPYVKYFNPPLNELTKLTCKIYDTHNATSISTKGIQMNLNFIVETTDKIRVY
tara:strand:+ start:632 stop:1132 length:501 start_codon:yes stop_codon:yes gene_type:complete